MVDSKTLHTTAPLKQAIDWNETFSTQWVDLLTKAKVFGHERNKEKWFVSMSNSAAFLKVTSLPAASASHIIQNELKVAKNGVIAYGDLCQLLLPILNKTVLKSHDDMALLKTPAQKIIDTLKEIREHQIRSGASKDMLDKINYAIDKIGSRTIFDIDHPILDTLDLHERGKNVTKGWIHEHSRLGLDLLRDQYLQNSQEQQKKRAPDSLSNAGSEFEAVSRAPSINTVMNFISDFDVELQNVEEIDFNIHRFTEHIGRKSALSVLTIHILQKLQLNKNPNLDEAVLSRFLGQIFKGYRREVEYHNDIHAADVLQMSYILMTRGGLLHLAKFNELDTLSIIIAAVCHDYDHDGLNNAYHVNAISARAIQYSDKAVQENYHVAESFAIMNKPEFNFMKEYSRDDFKTFRKRMIGIILATDMARHMSDLSTFKNLLEQKQVKEGKNASSLIDYSGPSEEFESKQFVIEICVHAADVSTQTRPFDIAVEWTWLLFEEFFNQGDLEKSQELPVSFLCDRETTQISCSQPGFVNFIVLPLFAAISDYMPEVKKLEDNARTNYTKWQENVESEEQKKIYVKRTKQQVGKRWNRDHLADSLSDDEECTTSPPKL